MSKVPLYKQLVDVTEDYLGPSSQRFIDRQIESHLGKQTRSITKKDLLELHDWLVAVVALLTDDESVLAEYASRLKSLESAMPSKK